MNEVSAPSNDLSTARPSRITRQRSKGKSASQTNSTLGPKVQQLRRRQGWSQAALAEQLGISASYLNLIEHGRRKLTANLLLQIAELFQLNLSDLAPDDQSQLLANLMESFGDDVFAGHDIKNTDVRDFVATNPEIARAVLHLHDISRNLRADVQSLTEKLEKTSSGEVNLVSNRLPSEQISDFIQANNNHFPSLESAAERVHSDIQWDSVGPLASLSSFLNNAFGVRVVLLPAAPDQSVLRRYDEASQTLYVSQLLTPDSQNFQIAHQIGLLAAQNDIEEIVELHGGLDGEARTLARITLANYFAAAVMMPYLEFYERAESFRYDIELLSRHFGVNFEQVCHRLTTLQRAGARGIPFHMLRVDIAGNISKQFSLSGIHIPRHGAACPRWNVYTAFQQPGRIHVQLSQQTDGSAYLCIARTVPKGLGGHGMPHHTMGIGLGCEIGHARKMVYADGLHLDDLDAAVPIGVSCRTCTRLECQHRAFPPVTKELNLDENVRSLSAYVAP